MTNKEVRLQELNNILAELESEHADALGELDVASSRVNEIEEKITNTKDEINELLESDE